MQRGLCRLSNSLWASPLHLVQKKSSDLCPYEDYCKLNEVILPDRYSILFLKTVNLVHAYQQISVRESDIPKPAITIRTFRISLYDIRIS